MNKLTKASIAGAAAIALLLGGAGTLALWNDSANLALGEIEAGTLTITAIDGSWDNEYDLWVPTDTATYSGQLTLDATGDNLEAQLSVDTSALAGSLGDYLTVTFDVTEIAGEVEESATAGIYDVTPNTGGDITVDVTVTVTFNDVDDELGQGLVVDLSQIDFVLQQI